MSNWDTVDGEGTFTNSEQSKLGMWVKIALVLEGACLNTGSPKVDKGQSQKFDRGQQQWQQQQQQK